MTDPAQPSAGYNTQSVRTLLRVVILCLIAAAAVASRLFSVIRKSPLRRAGARAAAVALRSCFTTADSDRRF